MNEIVWSEIFPPLELLAVILAFVYVILEIRGSIGLWLFGFLSGFVYAYIFGSARLYASMGIQIYYVLASIYGYYVWKKTASESSHDERVFNFSWDKWPFASLLFLGSAGVIYVLLSYTDTPSVLGESLVNGLSVLALWMLTRKYRQHWLVWIVVNVMAVYLYYSQALYPTAILYVLFFVLSIIGWFAWKRKYKQRYNHE